MEKIAAVGAGSGTTGCMPVFIGVTDAVPQWVLYTAGCAVKNRYPNVPHPNTQLTADKHELRLTFRFVMYSYLETPPRVASRHSENAPKILSSSGVMLMLFSLGQWPGRFN